MKYSLTIISISLIVSIIIGGIFLYPRYKTFNKLQDQVDLKEEQLKNQQDYLRFLDEMDKQAKKRQELIDRVTSAIPNEPDIPSFLNFLKDETINTGVGLEKISWSEYNPRDDKKQTNQYLINVQISGSYLAFKNFLNSLETSARLIEVLKTEFSIEPEESVLFDLGLKIHSY